MPLLPADQPRYLMGVGRPIDLIEAVLPRGRPVRLRDADAERPQCDGVHQSRDGEDAEPEVTSGTQVPLDPDCDCPTCREFSRGYLRHLFMAEEMLGPMLLSLHNLHVLPAVVRGLREAIKSNRLLDFRARQLAATGGDS